MPASSHDIVIAPAISDPIRARRLDAELHARKVGARRRLLQFDWSEDWAMLGGRQTKLQVAHTKLSHSRAFVVRVYLLQTHEMLFDALTQAFRVLGGVPQRGTFDNMRTAVDGMRARVAAPKPRREKATI